MGPVQRVSPLAQIAIGVALGLVVFGLPMSCGAGAQRLPALIECKVRAVDAVLPAEPGMLTVYDAIDIWERVRQCHRTHPGDAGAP